MNFTEEQIQRYSRQIVLKEVGGKGQRKLREAKIFVVGAGGLSSPAALYLAAAGVGQLGIIDADRVDLSNLQRQILHTTGSVNSPKVESARAMLSALNPDCEVRTYAEPLTTRNVESLFRDYHLIIDGTDNFSTRYLVNDAAFFLKKPLVTGSIFRFEGQITTFFADPANPGPCYRCLYPEPPPPGVIPSCQEAGVLGVLAGTIGVLQAVEALKLALNIGQPLSGKLMTYDALAMRFRTMKVRRDPNCVLCGEKPRITRLLDDYEVSCTLPAASAVPAKARTQDRSNV
jgi:adenylyltransferase/sulfurtransferase